MSLRSSLPFKHSELRNYLEETPIPVTRREFLLGGIGLTGLGLIGSLGWKRFFRYGKAKKPSHFSVAGSIVDDDSKVGHLLRQPFGDDMLPKPAGKTLPVLIIGGGVAGVSAGWKLRRAGVEDFLILDLGEQLGGTSTAGEANGTKFPWAAHYINTPPPEARCIIEVLRDLDVIIGLRHDGWPIVNPGHIVAEPEERLFINGLWLPAIDPTPEGTTYDKKVFREFDQDMQRWMLHKGRDGKRAFSIPMAYGSQDRDILALDRMSMREYISDKGWHSPQLDWYLNYCCKDDYCALIEDTSAWAGIHYHACRYYAAGLQDRFPVDTLTWPEGNNFLIKGMARDFKPENVRLNALVVAVRQDPDGVLVTFLDTKTRDLKTLQGEKAIFAGHKNIARYIVRNLPEDQNEAFAECVYSPWLTAAIHFKHLPETQGSETAWDNVMFGANSVGYVLADHQCNARRENRHDQPTVATFYLPLYERDVGANRVELLSRGHDHWVQKIMSELWEMHPGIETLVEKIDVKKIGHAMIRPKPGFIWGGNRMLRAQRFGHLSFANADTPGLPLFEEACFSGISAAEEVLRALKISFVESC
ncbi:NAD(P)-binding protein [candidate division KSB1 bacterium]|nr:NAD(P)-binding protein [candidate division KSB1 bacterium]